MAKNADVIEDSLDGKLLGNVIGAIKHHIRLLEIMVTNLW